MNTVSAFLTAVMLIVVAGGLGLTVSAQFHTQEALTQSIDDLQQAKTRLNHAMLNCSDTASQAFPMLGMNIGMGTVLPFGMAVIAAMCLGGREIHRRQTKNNRDKGEMDHWQSEESYQWQQYQALAAASRSRSDRYRR